MTPADLKAARHALGLKAAELGRALELEGRDPGRMVRLWETEVHPVPGPVAVAVRYMLADQARQSLQEAVEQAQAFLTPDPTAAALTAPSGPDLQPQPERPVTTRRRAARAGFAVIDPQRLR